MFFKNDSGISTVIIGSFRKHLNQILVLKHLLEKKGFHVLSPTGTTVVNPEDEFVIFDSDPIKDPKLLQDSVFTKIKHSTFIVVANFNSYLGRAAILEIGFAIAAGISIFTLEPTNDPHLDPYCRLLKEILPDIDFKLSSLESGVKECGLIGASGPLSLP